MCCAWSSERPAVLGVPAIVEYELRYGLLRLPSPAMKPRMAALEQLLRPLNRLPFDSECAGHATRIRTTREFARVPGLRCQDWHAT